MRYKSHKRMRERNGKLIAAAVILLILAAAALAVVGIFRIRSVEVVGNSHYSAQEIQARVMDDPYSGNSLYLYLKYKYLDTEEIPFVDKIEVNLLSVSKVRIRVYEKSLIGCVEYMGAYLYFDKDGVVVESSSTLQPDVPIISGLQFTRLALYEKLEVEDDEVFSAIMDLTQMLQKNALSPDRIEFKKNMEMELYFGDVRVNLGNGDLLEEKMGRLPQFLEDLEGKSGVLHMENYSEDSSIVSFKQDREEVQETD